MLNGFMCWCSIRLKEMCVHILSRIIPVSGSNRIELKGTSLVNFLMTFSC